MRAPRYSRIGLAVVLVAVLVAGLVLVLRTATGAGRVNVVAYFSNSNGVFVGDEVRILGVPVGKIARIEPQADRVKVEFWYSDRYQVPQDAKAVIIAPSLVSVRAIQLTPAYTSGPVMDDGALIGQDRTAVPIEFDDFRVQLERLTDTLQPTEPGGTSSLGNLVNTAADNLRGEGANIRDTLIKLSAAFSALGDNSRNLFGTIRNLSILVSALQSSRDLLTNVNRNLAATTNLISDQPDELGGAVSDINAVVGDVQSFVADNTESLGTTSDKVASVSTALVQSLDDIKQALHVFPNGFQNFLNIYQPAQGAFTGALAVNQFANPIQFLCGAVQAASRLGAEQSAKLCAQYLAPIIKNRQYNFPPVGINPFVGASARPNEVTYSEDRLRPDYVPPGPGTGPPGPLPPPNLPFTTFGEPADPYHGDPPFVPARVPDPIPPEPAQATDPGAGLPGLMVPAGAGFVTARRLRFCAAAVATALAVAGCSDWRGANSLPLPGTSGQGPGSYTIRAELPDVDNIDRNSRVRVGDVTVGNVTDIARQDWHAVLTMQIDGDVVLPANATATVGQTSLLGSLHIDLAPPVGWRRRGRLADGAVIPLSASGGYPTTEQTLAAVSVLLNGGGIGQLQDIIGTLAAAFNGREGDLRSLIGEIDTFVTYLNDQTGDIIAASDGLNRLAGQIAEQKPVVDKALKTVPEALAVLEDQRGHLVEALDTLGQFSAFAADSVNQTKENLVKELQAIGPVLKSLGDAGPALTRSLDFFTTFPFPRPTLDKWLRGDSANLTAVVDLTLSRLDAGLLTGTFLEGELTELELQWGRTIGQMPSPYTARNPLIAPYQFNQGP